MHTKIYTFLIREMLVTPEEPKEQQCPTTEAFKNCGVYLWRIHVDVWQNQYNTVKQKKERKKEIANKSANYD